MYNRLKVQHFLINKIVEAYAGDNEIEQEAWVRVVANYARDRGFSKKLIASVEERFDSASDLYFLCRERGNIDMMETARNLMSAYFAVQQGIAGFGSAPEYLLDSYIEQLVAA